jgi:NAD(P)-dependent dehydrogenase (short-subunit alcohol dehydrogenase family)
MDQRTVTIAGVGETLGTALARAFVDCGDAVALLARSADGVVTQFVDYAETPPETVTVRIP